MPRYPAWRIHYADGSVVQGRTRKEWRAAPDTGVQVVELDAPYPDRDGMPVRPWVGVEDRQIWTGDDEYELKPGWGVKQGSLLSDDEYERIWKRAFWGKA